MILTLLALNTLIGLLSLAGVIILLFKGRSVSNYVSSDKTMAGGVQKKPSPSDVEVASGVVFCRNCGNQYDSSSAVCPNCKTPH
ncbi:MAG: hydrogenase maturation nickel metallochaperone HypA [Clostridiales bacterium]|nr:hydrogenase maturation nickel metallochaperone HypA [Clostridiales bacterium]